MFVCLNIPIPLLSRCISNIILFSKYYQLNMFLYIAFTQTFQMTSSRVDQENPVQKKSTPVASATPAQSLALAHH